MKENLPMNDFFGWKRHPFADTYVQRQCWLPDDDSRELDREGINFFVHGNKFLHIAYYQKAQRLLDKQLDIRFANLLNGFALRIFFNMKDILGPYLSYYWTLWQSEWATDFIFDTSASLNSIMDSLLGCLNCAAGE